MLEGIYITPNGTLFRKATETVDLENLETGEHIETGTAYHHLIDLPNEGLCLLVTTTDFKEHPQKDYYSVVNLLAEAQYTYNSDFIEEDFDAHPEENIKGGEEHYRVLFKEAKDKYEPVLLELPEKVHQIVRVHLDKHHGIEVNL